MLINRECRLHNGRWSLGVSDPCGSTLATDPRGTLDNFDFPEKTVKMEVG